MRIRPVILYLIYKVKQPIDPKRSQNHVLKPGHAVPEHPATQTQQIYGMQSHLPKTNLGRLAIGISLENEKQIVHLSSKRTFRNRMMIIGLSKNTLFYLFIYFLNSHGKKNRNGQKLNLIVYNPKRGRRKLRQRRSPFKI